MRKRLLDRYGEALLAADRISDGGYIGEVRQRLEQADLLLRKAKESERTASAAIKRSQEAFKEYVESATIKEFTTTEAPRDVAVTPEEHQVWNDASLELLTFTEAFYYFAHRVRQIFRKELIPGLKRFEAEGVRNVRNHLMEHPESKDGVEAPHSWGWGKEHGPVLKAVRPVGDMRFSDPGLYVNAQELADNLEAALQRALERVWGEPYGEVDGSRAG